MLAQVARGDNQVPPSCVAIGLALATYIYVCRHVLCHLHVSRSHACNHGFPAIRSGNAMYVYMDGCRVVAEVNRRAVTQFPAAIGEHHGSLMLLLRSKYSVHRPPTCLKQTFAVGCNGDDLPDFVPAILSLSQFCIRVALCIAGHNWHPQVAQSTIRLVHVDNVACVVAIICASLCRECEERLRS